MQLGEKKRPFCPLSSKWQIGLLLWHKPYRGGAGSAGGAKRPPRGSRGAAPARLWFLSSLNERNPGCGPGRPTGGCWGYQPHKSPRGRRGGAPSPQQAHTRRREAGSWAPHQTNTQKRMTKTSSCKNERSQRQATCARAFSLDPQEVRSRIGCRLSLPRIGRGIMPPRIGCGLSLPPREKS